MLELLLVKYFTSYTVYNIYKQYINTNKLKDNNKELYNIYLSLDSIYNKYKRDITIEELEIYFYSERPFLKDKDKELYDALFKTINEKNINEELIENVLLSMKQRQEAFDLSTKAYEVSQGRGSFVDLITQAHQLEHDESLDEVDEDVFVTRSEER